MGNFVPSLADIGQQFAGDIESGLGTVSEVGQASFFSAFAASAVLSTRLQQVKSLSNLVQTTTGSALDLAKNALKQTLGDKGSNLSDAARSLQTFGEQPWDTLATQSGVPTPSPSAETSLSTAESFSSIAAPTSSSLSVTPTASSSTVVSSSTFTSSATTTTPNCQTAIGGLVQRGEQAQETNLVTPSACLLSTSSTSSSSSSSSATPEPTRSAYWIWTKAGTDRNDFITFTKTLPDNGTGDLSPERGVISWQSYNTFLNESEAESVRQLPFVRSCVKLLLGDEDDGQSGFRAINQTRAPILPKLQGKFDEPHPANSNLGLRQPSPDHLKLISRRAGGPTAGDYLFDQTLGRGVTIYIIDTGFRFSSHVSYITVPKEVFLN
jgi:hypothetical protein